MKSMLAFAALAATVAVSTVRVSGEFKFLHLTLALFPSHLPPTKRTAALHNTPAAVRVMLSAGYQCVLRTRHRRQEKGEAGVVMTQGFNFCLGRHRHRRNAGSVPAPTPLEAPSVWVRSCLQSLGLLSPVRVHRSSWIGLFGEGPEGFGHIVILRLFSDSLVNGGGQTEPVPLLRGPASRIHRDAGIDEVGLLR